jgi:hypothetical protein
MLIETINFCISMSRACPIYDCISKAVTSNTRELPIYCGIRGSYDGEYEGYCLLGCEAVKSGRYFQIFQGNLLPPSSGERILIP